MPGEHRELLRVAHQPLCFLPSRQGMSQRAHGRIEHRSWRLQNSVADSADRISWTCSLTHSDIRAEVLLCGAGWGTVGRRVREQALEYLYQITMKTGLQSFRPAFAVIDFDSTLC